MPLIPLENLVNWTPGTHVGVIGGIPTDRNTLIDVTQAPYNADNTGATDTHDAIQAAIDAAGSGEVVYLPAGTYRLDSALAAGPSFSGKSIRGDGIDVTIISVHANGCIQIGSATGFTYPGITAVSGVAKGSTEIDVSDASTITVGDLMVVQVENDDSLPVVSVYNYNVQTNEAPTNQLIKITSKTGDTIEFWPPLHYDYTGEIRLGRTIQRADWIGIEDLTVDCTPYNGPGGVTGSFVGIYMVQCDNSWIKNVKSVFAWNYTIIMATCLNCEVRGSWFGNLKGSGSNGAGLLFGGYSTLVEDNVGVDAFPIIEMNAGASGNVIGYNYGGDDGMWNSNHAPHNQFNLFEGNMGAFHMSDGYFGSEAFLTHYRNWWRQISMNLRRFTRNVAAVGNILSGQIGCGLPNIGNGDSDGTADYPSDPWRDWAMSGTLTTRTSDDVGEITLASGLLFGGNVQSIRMVWGAGLDNQKFGHVATMIGSVAAITGSLGTPLPIVGTEIFIGPGSYFSGDSATSSYQELDLGVEGSLTKKANYYEDSTDFDPLGPDPLVDSLYTDLAGLEARGVDWGMNPYPPVDPGSPGDVTISGLPAGRRFLAEEPLAAPEITSSCTVNGSPVEGQILTADPGSVTGNPPPARTWKWQRDGVDIIGATNQTYLLTDDDVGFDVGPVQIETNTEGSDESVATPLTILAFTGDILVVTQVANASPVTELWLRGALTDGVSAPLEYYLVQHSGPYPTQPDNNFVYARFGTPQDNVYVFQGTISEAEAVASIP